MFVEVKERPLAPIEIPFDWKAAAKHKIRQRGWWHAGSPSCNFTADAKDDPGPCDLPRPICVGMAVMEMGGHEAVDALAYRITGYAQPDPANAFTSIAFWNDAPERTLAEVFAMIDAA